MALQKRPKRLLVLGSLSLPTPSVMGILNVTPDSFSDGGKFNTVNAARQQAETMAEEGAAIIDIGGESTRPGAVDVSVECELERIIPVIEAVKESTALPISVDTSKPDVMREVASAGAALINDVTALQTPGASAAIASLGLPVCLMHMKGRPRTMQKSPEYDDVVAEVTSFLSERVAKCVEDGIARDRIIIDPGFGFGKTVAHNVELLANLRQLQELELPILVGLSRKRSLGDITGKGVDDRIPASVAAATIAVLHGASIIRAHDVNETVDAMQIASAVLDSGI